MCVTCDNKRAVISTYAERRYDPTMTQGLRDRFAADMNRRFNGLKAIITQAIVTQDCFGFKQKRVGILTLSSGFNTPGPGAFAFPRSADKSAAFMEWLRQQVNKGVLQVGSMPQLGRAVEEPWTNLYVTDSYKRGVMRARYELGRAGRPVPSLDATGGISASMSTPFHLDRLGLIYSRVYEELKGVTAAMDSQISRILAQGMGDGDGPALLARKMRAAISGPMGDLGITDSLGRFIPAQRRAMMIARTETVRAHHQAMIQEYKNWAVEGVMVQAEWRTATDDRVCDQCSQLEGKIYTLDEINNLIPAHPQCRCIALPTMPGTAKTKAPAAAPEPPAPQIADEFTPFDKVSLTKDYGYTNIQVDGAGRSLKDMGLSNVQLDNSLSAAASAERLNIVGDVIGNRIMARLPKIKELSQFSDGMLGRVNLASIDLRAAEQLVGPGKGALAQYAPGTRSISIGQRGMNVRKYGKPQFGKNAWSTGGETMQTNISHEYGHHVHVRMLSIRERSEWNVFYKQKGRPFFETHLSKYGATDHLESFAEAFSAYVHPQYKRGMLHTEIETMLEKLIGKRIDL